MPERSYTRVEREYYQFELEHTHLKQTIEGMETYIKEVPESGEALEFKQSLPKLYFALRDVKINMDALRHQFEKDRAERVKDI